MRFSDFITREERHYCAFLFSWLIDDPINVEKFLKQIHGLKLSIAENHEYRLFYEFPFLREIIHGTKGEVKRQLKAEITKYFAGDSQKKKPDIAIFDTSNGNLFLIEAKFESGFQYRQLEETMTYGMLCKKYSTDFKSFEVILLGLNYFLDSELKGRGSKLCECLNMHPKISWEKVVELCGIKSIQGKEIEAGMMFQRKTHARLNKYNQLMP